MNEKGKTEASFPCLTAWCHDDPNPLVAWNKALPVLTAVWNLLMDLSFIYKFSFTAMMN